MSHLSHAQILTNLISNAIRYTAEGNVTVTCYTPDDLKDGFWEMTVRDTGKGISPKR